MMEDDECWISGRTLYAGSFYMITGQNGFSNVCSAMD